MRWTCCVPPGSDAKLATVARDLSHGEQQALELAMVLALEPRIVLLDEPTAGLTRPSARRSARCCRRWRTGTGLCCLLVEHDLDFVEQIATRIVVLHQGTIVMQGSFEEVVNSPLVKTIYAGSAHAPQEAA
jgi:branched-chain amino acid transport system permease protein